MNRSSLLLGAGLGLLLAAGPARAADVAVADAGRWTGFYLGAQAGYLQGSGDPGICVSVTGLARDCTGLPADFGLGDGADGVTAGGYLGFNYRIDRLVLGIEGDIAWASAQDSGAGAPADVDNPFGPQSLSLGWDASVRLRLGAIVGERALLYVTGGPGWTGMELDNGFCRTIRGEENISCGGSATAFGWQLGGGAEYFITDRLSMKAEYLHGWYGETDLNIFTIGEAGSAMKYDARQSLQTNVVRAGFAWHFGGL